MIRWLTRLFDPHARLRDRLSAYADGELDARAVERIEAHLAGCEPCREELEGLRLTSAALAGLPEAEVPRSFALRPAQVEKRQLAAEPFLPPLAIATRLAAAGVAVALAAVVVIDVGNLGDDGGAVQTSAPDAQSERGVGFDANDDAFGGDGALAPEEPAAGGDGGTGGGAGGAGGPVGESAPEPDADTTDSLSDEGDVEDPAVPPTEPAIESDDGGGGIDTLTAVEIGLGAALAVLIVATVAVTFARRRRWS